MTHHPIRRPGSAILALLLLAACSPGGEAAEKATGDTAAVEGVAMPAPEAKARPLACALVTGAEMSAILGSPVVAAPNDRSSNKTECIYSAADGVSPYVELSVAWGDGEAAMTAMGEMGKVEPGIADPYAGIGDQAASIGPTLMIRTGEDLMNIVFSGVTDAPAAAKRIFDTAHPRM
jgi:hypothetical protein